MKRWSMIVLLAWAAQISAAWAQKGDGAAPSDTNAGGGGAGLEFHFHDAPVSQVLDYLSREAGFIVVSDESASGQRITLESQGSLTPRQGLDLLNAALASSGGAARLEGRLLTVGRAAELAGGPEVEAPRGWEEIPNDDKMVTQVIALSSLQPAALAQELAGLMAEGAKLAVSESGKALVMTARQADARRFAHIVQLLDHTADATVAVFPMAHGDAKAVADELKEVFGSADSSINTMAWNVGMASGARQGQGQGRAPGSRGTTGAKSGGAAPVFTADETLNAVVAAAAPELMESVRVVIAELDAPTDELTVARIFPLKHANAADTAQELMVSFGTSDSTSDSRNAGPIFAAGPTGLRLLEGAGSGQSKRALKQAQVTAVADARTQSVIVTASKSAMENIAGIIRNLDASDAQTEVVTVFDLNQVDPADAADAMQALFASAQNQSALTVESPLVDRAKTAANQQTGTAATSFGQTGQTGSGH